jgi:hypothetical protein
MSVTQILCALMLAVALFALGALAWRDLGWRNRERREVDGAVVGFKKSMNRGAEVFAPVIRFAADGAEHEITDIVFSERPKRAVGDRVALVYPDGRPDLARIPRPALGAMIYAAFVVMALMAAAGTAGWLS